METNEKTKKNGILKAIIILVILAVIALGVGFAYARYITKLNGQVTADIANYNFDVTVGNNTNLNIDLANTRLANDTTKVASGQVAPDTKGAFNLNVDATGSNVTLIYNIDLDLSGAPENLKFYSDSNMKNEVMVQDDKIKIEDCIGINDSKTKTITLYWQWPYETGENDYEISLNDAKDSAWMGHDIEIAVSATSKQVPEKVTYLADSVSIGDYVNYDATSGDGAGLSITPTSDLTGSETTTTFNSSDISGWRVYDVDSITKTVRLIAAEPTDSTLTLSGKDGWQNAESLLNSVGEIYGHGYGAVDGSSIQRKDILLKSSYDISLYKNNEHKTNGINDGYYFYTGNTNRQETETYTSGTFLMYDKSEIMATTEHPVTMRQTLYRFNASSFMDVKDFNLLFRKSTDSTEEKKTFWINGKGMYLAKSYCAYSVDIATHDDSYFHFLHYSDGRRDPNQSNSVMPIVTLQSNIQVTGRDLNNVWQLDIE